MAKSEDFIKNLMVLPHEYEWLDFKESWFSKDEIGEYISAISNGAALCGREFGYIVWGIHNSTHEIIGTTVNFDKDVDHEPYKHYLARNLKPSVAFDVEDVQIDGKRVKESPKGEITTLSLQKIIDENKHEYFADEGIVRFEDSEAYYERNYNGCNSDWSQFINVEKWQSYCPEHPISPEK